MYGVPLKTVESWPTEPDAKSASGNLSPSCEIPDHLDFEWFSTMKIYQWTIFTPTSLMLHTDFENRTMCQYVEVLEPCLWLLQFPVIEMMTHFSFKDLNLDNFSIFLNGHQTMLQCKQYSEVCCLCEIRTTVRNQCIRLHHFLACFYLCCIMLGRPCHCEMSLVQNPTEISTINIKYPLCSLYIYLFSYLRWSWS